MCAMGKSVFLRDCDLIKLLDTADGLDYGNGLGIRDVLDSLASLVPCDVSSGTGTAWDLRSSSALIDATATRPVLHAPMTPWLEHLPEHPIMSGRHGPVVAISDVLRPREFERTWLFQEAMRPAGVAHEIGMELSHTAGEMSVVVISRGPGRDFDDRDHLTLRLLRPHVDAALRRLILPPPEFTSREREVMLLVRDGLTDAQVARRLGVVEATASKHLEHVSAAPVHTAGCRP